MEKRKSDEQEVRNHAGKPALVVLALIMLCLGMIASVYYPWPSGEPLEVAGFVGLWLREIVIVGIAVFAVLVFGAMRLRKTFRRLVARGKSAP